MSATTSPGTPPRVRLATMWLDGCSGCHMSLLDIDEALVAVAPRIEMVYGPLVDAQEFPENVDVTLIEGAVSNHDDLEHVRTARARSRLLVALGDCAVTSNVPSMRNRWPVKNLLETIYVAGPDTGRLVPTEGVPPLLKKSVPLHDIVKIDLHVPGCPPAAPVILFTLTALLDGHMPDFTDPCVVSKVRFG